MRDRFSVIADGVVAGSEFSWRSLDLLVGGVAAEGDAGDVGWLRLGLSRLLSDGLAADDRTRILALDAVLEGAERQLDHARARRGREKDRRTLREKVATALQGAGPIRPRELAELCGADIYQVSRALRDLRSNSTVVTTPAPPGEADRRGVWYRLAAEESSGAQSVTGPSRSAFHVTIEPGPSHVRGVLVQAWVLGSPIWTHSSLPAFVDAGSALRRLSQSWLSLLLEDGLPGGHTPRNLDAIDSVMLRSDRFVQNHDLARIVGFLSGEPLWLSREGGRFWILTRSNAIAVPVNAVVSELTALGESLLAAAIDGGSGQSFELSEVWQNRSEASIEQRVAIATGIPSPKLQEITAGADASSFWELDRDSNEVGELVAAARMSAAIPPQQIAELLEVIRECAWIDTAELDALSTNTIHALEGQPHLRPFEQGYLAAGLVREYLGLEDGCPPIDPDRLLSDWGVPIKVVESDRSIDAIACWGPRHGPMVALNRVGQHSAHSNGRRMTLAHEIAHLLIDRHGALPVAEVLGGTVAPFAEARARAFAAELLLPRRHAAEVMVRSASPAAAVDELVETHGIGSEAVAWQIRNSGESLSGEQYRHLRGLVSRQSDF